jgi:hypothetical protein
MAIGTESRTKGRCQMGVVTPKALMSLAKRLARDVRVAVGTGLRRTIRMPLVASVALLVRCWPPRVDGCDLGAMTGNTGRAALRLSMYPVATHAVGMLAAPESNRIVTIGTDQRRSTGWTVCLMTLRAAVTMGS